VSRTFGLLLVVEKTQSYRFASFVIVHIDTGAKVFMYLGRIQELSRKFIRKANIIPTSSPLPPVLGNHAIFVRIVASAGIELTVCACPRYGVADGSRSDGVDECCFTTS
jgi:hypothetical protein